MRGLIKRTPECALHVHVGTAGHRRRRARADERHARAAAAAPRARRELAVLVRRRLGHGQRALGGDPRLSGPRRSRRSLRGLGRVPRAASTPCGPAAARPTTRWSGGTRGRSRGSAPSSCARWTSRPTSSRPAAIAALARAIMTRAVEDPVTDPAPEQALHWSSFRAARDGLDAEICVRRLTAPAARGRGGGAQDRIGAGRRPRARGHKANRPRGRRGGPAASRLQRRRHAGPAPLPRGRNCYVGTYAASRRAETASSCASRRSARSSSWRTRSLERPRRRPVSRSACGCSRSSPKRSVITSRSASGSVSTASRSALVLDARHDLVLHGRAVAGDQVAEGGVPVLADALVQAGRAAVGAADVGHLVERQLDELRRSPPRWACDRARRRACARRPGSSAPAPRCGPGGGRCGPSWRGRGRSPGESRACRRWRT